MPGLRQGAGREITMTIGELIEQLRKLPPDWKVLVGAYCDDEVEVTRLEQFPDQRSMPILGHDPPSVRLR